MIELNLMPRNMRAIDSKKKKASFDFKIPNIPPVPVIIGVIAVIIISQIMLGLVSLVQKGQLSRISEEIADIASQQAIAAALKREVDELSSKFTAIEGLTQGSLVWSKKLYDLSNAMIDGIWLSSLLLNVETPRAISQAYTAAGRPQDADSRQTLVLTGFAISSSRAEETAAVGKFIESLKKNEGFFRDFDDIKLSSIQRESYGNTDVMGFTLICYFKADRSYFEKLKS
jgi:hypothetical protein